MNEELKFTATGIGCMPFLETESTLSLIGKSLPLLPHWPQLPKRGEQEHFIFQYLAPLVKLGLIAIEEGKAPYMNSEYADLPEKLTAFYELYLSVEAGDEEALEAFAFPPDSAIGFYAFCEAVQNNEFPYAKFLKGQISGPLSVALTLTDQDRRSVYYDSQFRDVIVKTLALHTKWQAKKLGGLGKQAIIFIDDPSLYALGASSHITLTKEEVTEELKTVIDAAKDEGSLVGVHSCANVDWSLLLTIGIDFLSFDAYGYFDNLLLYGDDITAFLKQGGTLAWGIVPTSEAIFDETAETLYIRLLSHIDALAAKGVPRELILSNAVLTPSCGTGTLSIETAERIYKVLSELTFVNP